MEQNPRVVDSSLGSYILDFGLEQSDSSIGEDAPPTTPTHPASQATRRSEREQSRQQGAVPAELERVVRRGLEDAWEVLPNEHVALLSRALGAVEGADEGKTQNERPQCWGQKWWWHTGS